MELLTKIKDKRAQQNIRKLFDNEEIEEMLEYIEAYGMQTVWTQSTQKGELLSREECCTIA